MPPAAVEAWHELVGTDNPGLLDELLDEDVVFHSPVVHTPQRGKQITKLYLTAASQVFFGDAFKYRRELISDHDAVLEFTTEIDGITINGVDMLTWNDDGKITEFKVMIRPLKAINLIHRMMGEMLEQMKNSAPPQ